MCRIENNSFKDLNNLGQLHLKSNLIDEIETNEFNGFAELKELILEDNKIMTIHPFAFSLKELNKLYLNQNLFRISTA